MAVQTESPVAAVILERLVDEGRITFAQFMELALYAPEIGYYEAQAAMGASGDYVTSPEVHPAFGALIGRQAQDCWHALGRPKSFAVREFGAGRGTLCRDLLAWANHAAPEFAACLRYEIVERSSSMRARQRETLDTAGPASEKLSWLDPGAALSHPRAFTGVVVSNELLDSFPVHLVTVREGRLRELYVAARGRGDGETGGRGDDSGLGTRDSGLELVEGEPSTPELERYFGRLGLLPGERCMAEVNLEAAAWMASLAESMDRGLVLTLDYGYPAGELYAPARRYGTLLCYYRHTVASDPLVRVGRQDITTHVDFTTVSATAEQHGLHGLRGLGLISQAHMMENLGVGDYLNGFRWLDATLATENRRAVQTLLDPEGLGRVGGLFQQRGLEGYVPLGLVGGFRPSITAEVGRFLPVLDASGSIAGARWEEDGPGDFRKQWQAFVTGDERELDEIQGD